MLPFPLPTPLQDQPIAAATVAADQQALLDSLTQLVSTVPGLALERASQIRNEAQREHLFKLAFLSAAALQPGAAVPYLSRAIDRPWIGELAVPNACAVAALAENQSPGLAEQLVWATARRNPEVALREFKAILALSFGRRLFDRVVMAAPGDAIALAFGEMRPALRYRELLRASQRPEVKLLAELADDGSIDPPRLSRIAFLHRRIASGALSKSAALAIAANPARYFATLVDMRIAASAEEATPLDRSLEGEAQHLCMAFAQTGGRAPTPELAAFPARDLYLVLAYGRAEAAAPAFAVVFDSLLLPRLRAIKGSVFDQTHDLKLRELVALALALHRLDALLPIAGSSIVDRVALGIDQADDPLQAAITAVEVINALGSRPSLLQQMGAAIEREFVRTRQAGNRSAQTLYGLLAANLAQMPAAGDATRRIAQPYLPYLAAIATLDTRPLFDAAGLCVERHFFYDDDDGVESYQSFLSTYQKDSAWKIQDHGIFVQISAEGANGRRVEIFANVPVDPLRRGAGEAQRRQQAISEELRARRLTPTMLVHRGHNVHADKTIQYVNHDVRLVFLGSCGGSTDVHSVIERSRDSQVIATRGIGTTQINDAILKSLNDWLIAGEPVIQWSEFWQLQRKKFGASALFRDYFAPDQDAASMFLRAYYQASE